MRSWMPNHAIAVMVASSLLTACGGEETFEPDLASNERLIEREAVARIAKYDEWFQQLIAVGDLDGDGIDDAVVRTNFDLPDSPGAWDGAHVYIVYGGRALIGEIDLAGVPRLTGVAAQRYSVMEPVGDVNGDGKADLLISTEGADWCGAHLVYGSAARLVGATPVTETGVLLRDAGPCALGDTLLPLGDLDGDGKADFAVSRLSASGPRQVLVFYGRGERLSGTREVQTTADATIRGLTVVGTAGDVDRDGRSDFFVSLVHAEPDTTWTVEGGLVRGSATRLAGTVGPADLTQSRFVFREGRVGKNRTFGGVGLGDLDGDGTGDFSVTSHDLSVPPSERFVGLYVFYGRPAGFPAEIELAGADAMLDVPVDGRVLSGDVDGDGVLDLIVSDPQLHGRNGGVHVIGGSRRLPLHLDLAAEGTSYVGRHRRVSPCGDYGLSDCIAYERVGVDLGVGDLTGDGRADFLASAPTDQLRGAVVGVSGSALAHSYLVSPGVGRRP